MVARPERNPYFVTGHPSLCLSFICVYMCVSVYGHLLCMCKDVCEWIRIGCKFSPSINRPPNIQQVGSLIILTLTTLTQSSSERVSSISLTEVLISFSVKPDTLPLLKKKTRKKYLTASHSNLSAQFLSCEILLDVIRTASALGNTLHYVAKLERHAFQSGEIMMDAGRLWISKIIKQLTHPRELAYLSVRRLLECTQMVINECKHISGLRHIYSEGQPFA